MKRVFFVGIFLFLIAGCCLFKTKPDPILTSKDESWYIPKGIEFQAKKKPLENLQTYKADDDLIVLYMGSYLELEKKANSCSR
jgi:hypothetical protein